MLKDRIEKIIRDEDITSSKFADEIGVQRSSISHTMSGRNKPSLDLIIKIIERYRYINSEWLITGRGEPYKSLNKENSNLFSDIEDEETEQNQVMDEKEHFIDLPNKSEADIKKDTENKTEQKVSKAKHIKKIMIFYSDNSFEELMPKQE